MLNGKQIVLGVTGGIAAYKAVDVVSRLKKEGANVFVIMTESAKQFVQPLTFQSISQNYVVTDMFEDPKTWDVEHIALAKRADLFLVVPATANVVGKVANGIADDMLTTTIMATEAPVFFALAMNTKMYENPLFKMNVEKLSALNYRFIQPSSGRLACGDVGSGKLEDPEEIVECVKKHFQNKGPLKNKKVLITAGPTREPIDPVRYISNRSSGKMGYALAEVARDLGADVILVSGPTFLKTPENIHCISVETTDEMFQAVMEHKDADIIIKSAAPSDYRPSEYADEKIKKHDLGMSLNLVRNKDILKTLGSHKREGQFLVGFAAETQHLEQYALKKLKEKNLDFIVANDVSKPQAGFDVDTNIVTIYHQNGKKECYECMTKKDISKIILSKMCSTEE